MKKNKNKVTTTTTSRVSSCPLSVYGLPPPPLPLPARSALGSVVVCWKFLTPDGDQVVLWLTTNEHRAASQQVFSAFIFCQIKTSNAVKIAPIRDQVISLNIYLPIITQQAHRLVGTVIMKVACRLDRLRKWRSKQILGVSIGHRTPNWFSSQF